MYVCIEVVSVFSARLGGGVPQLLEDSLNHVNKGAQMGSRWFASISNIQNATFPFLSMRRKM